MEVIYSEHLNRKARAREAQRVKAERKEAARIATLTPLERVTEKIYGHMVGCEYGDGWDFDELKELFRQYLAIEAGETA